MSLMLAVDATGGAAELIFVSIASYRDAQLVPTVGDCIAKARWPERLRFGICWQHGEDEGPLPFVEDGRFRVLDVDWRESRGACWARARIMELYAGEAWYLQVDSHCRFAPGWDQTLIIMAAATGAEKPVLSSYPPPFTPGQLEPLQVDPLLMAYQGFTADGIPFMKPLPIAGWQAGRSPMRARFLAAGFLFAPGSFVREVPYDPELYFIGEEITMTVRAFSCGYDLFHPCAAVVWHDYVRAYAVRHWEDHTAANEVQQEWNALDDASKVKVRRLLAGEAVEAGGLGSVRTLAEYEAFAGLSFARRKGQNATLLAQEPPNAPAEDSWADGIVPWMVRVAVRREDLPDGAFDDPAFWYVAVLDEAGREIFRRDFPRAELEMLTGAEARITLVCEFEAGIVPARWSVWPVSRSLGWLRRVMGRLAKEDFAVVLEE